MVWRPESPTADAIRATIRIRQRDARTASSTVSNGKYMQTRLAITIKHDDVDDRRRRA